MSPLSNSNLAQFAEPFKPGMEALEGPLPLYRNPPEPDPFPVDALGTILSDAVEAIVDKTQAPVEIAAQSVLACVTLSAQSHVNVSFANISERPVSCFFLSIAESGERKSAVDDFAVGPVKDYEKELREGYESAFADYFNELEAWEAQRRQITSTKTKDATSKEDKAKALGELGPKPSEPLKPIVLVGSPTFEGVCKLLAEGQPSLGMLSGEGGQFIGGHSMSAEKKLGTAAGLSELWDSGTTERIRSGDGAHKYYGRRLSLHLMAQPDVAAAMLSDRQLMDQGLLSRVLVSAPKPKTGTRFYREAQPESETKLRVYRARLSSLMRLNPPTDGKPNQLAPRLLPLSRGARDLWIAYSNHNERLMAPNGELSTIKGLGNKLAEHATRLAGALTFFDNPDAQEVDEAHMSAGIKLASYYGSEALRLFQVGTTDPDLVLAQKLTDWLQENFQEQSVALRTIYHRGPNAIRDSKVARRIMGILADHNHAIPVEGGAKIDGRRCKEAWEVPVV